MLRIAGVVSEEFEWLLSKLSELSIVVHTSGVTHEGTRIGRLGRDPASFRVTERIAVPCVMTAPVARVFTEPDVAMEGRPGPVDYATDEVVLQRVDVDVIDTAFQVLVVATGMLVEPSLPDPAFLPPPPTGPEGPLHAARFQPDPRETRLDQAPASGIVGVTRWSLPDRVEVVGQQDNGRDAKRALRPDRSNRGSKRSPPLLRREDAAPVMGHDGEEV